MHACTCTSRMHMHSCICAVCMAVCRCAIQAMWASRAGRAVNSRSLHMAWRHHGDVHGDDHEMGRGAPHLTARHACDAERRINASDVCHTRSCLPREPRRRISAHTSRRGDEQVRWASPTPSVWLDTRSSAQPKTRRGEDMRWQRRGRLCGGKCRRGCAAPQRREPLRRLTESCGPNPLKAAPLRVRAAHYREGASGCSTAASLCAGSCPGFGRLAAAPPPTARSATG